jgi:hypothetical protein
MPGVFLPKRLCRTALSMALESPVQLNFTGTPGPSPLTLTRGPITPVLSSASR